MPWNVSRSVGTVEKEILKFPAGLDAIESVVLKADGAPTLSSALTGSTQVVAGYRAGTVLQLVSGDSQNRYEVWDGNSPNTIEGILGDNVYFYDDTDASDEPADMLFHGVVFDTTKLGGADRAYEGNESDVAGALPTCKFWEEN
jgi:hypothetical protein